MFSSAAWARAHTQNVELNERDMLIAAAPLSYRSLRSGNTRQPLPPPVVRQPQIQSPSPSPPPPASPWSPAPIFDDDDGINDIFDLPQIDDEIPEEQTLFVTPPPALPSSPAPAPASLSSRQFDDANTADQPRLPWGWTLAGRSREAYVPSVSGKWWSVREDEMVGWAEDKRRNTGHIGRIMETELGERLVGEERCSACQSEDQECWVYTAKGAKQVARPGDTCARCRVVARKGGCSLSRRKPSGYRRRSPSPGPRPLAVKPPGGPPPGAGGMGIVV